VQLQAQRLCSTTIETGGVNSGGPFGNHSPARPNRSCSGSAALVCANQLGLIVNLADLGSENPSVILD
jgi:hypothetical protein